ncbi:DUF6869 domain-containing protein [Marimonas arenosa]|uniref:DUF6869 domain-containing protein n=1 Tax=Marimonas arenosa TaxID=1795305 RepID=A0AAE4B6J9_9RHOB|nr:hypothetical protein [Marimonas arenosa]MDQ2091429.1 hypothetical protein [Marimonas arenosa]
MPRPCQRDGQFSADRVAAAVLAHYAAAEADEAYAWAYSCLSSLEYDDPEMAWDLTLRMIRLVSTTQIAGVVAAGSLEQLLADHPDAFVPRAETLARTSARFRFMLSGVWPQKRQDSPGWQRILAARAPGPDMDAGDPLPPNDLPD